MALFLRSDDGVQLWFAQRETIEWSEGLVSTGEQLMHDCCKLASAGRMHESPGYDPRSSKPWDKLSLGQM